MKYPKGLKNNSVVAISLNVQMMKINQGDYHLEYL